MSATLGFLRNCTRAAGLSSRGVRLRTSGAAPYPKIRKCSATPSARHRFSLPISHLGNGGVEDGSKNAPRGVRRQTTIDSRFWNPQKRRARRRQCARTGRSPTALRTGSFDPELPFPISAVRAKNTRKRTWRYGQKRAFRHQSGAWRGLRFASLTSEPFQVRQRRIDPRRYRRRAELRQLGKCSGRPLRQMK